MPICWINEKAKTLKQGAIRAMFDRANTMTGVISLGIGEPDMPTPKLVCEACKEALDKGIAPHKIRRSVTERRGKHRVSNHLVPLSFFSYFFLFFLIVNAGRAGSGKRPCRKQPYRRRPCRHTWSAAAGLVDPEFSKP